MTECYICKGEYFGCSRFSNTRDNELEMFPLCIVCYFNFIKAFEVSRKTILQTKTSISTILNSKDGELGNKIKDLIDKNSH
jgi:hypothetical protein